MISPPKRTATAAQLRTNTVAVTWLKRLRRGIDSSAAYATLTQEPTIACSPSNHRGQARSLAVECEGCARCFLLLYSILSLAFGSVIDLNRKIYYNLGCPQIPL